MLLPGLGPLPQGGPPGWSLPGHIAEVGRGGRVPASIPWLTLELPLPWIGSQHPLVLGRAVWPVPTETLLAPPRVSPSATGCLADCPWSTVCRLGGGRSTQAL